MERNTPFDDCLTTGRDRRERRQQASRATFGAAVAAGLGLRIEEQGHQRHEWMAHDDRPFCQRRGRGPRPVHLPDRSPGSRGVPQHGRIAKVADACDGGVTRTAGWSGKFCVTLPRCRRASARSCCPGTPRGPRRSKRSTKRALDRADRHGACAPRAPQPGAGRLEHALRGALQGVTAGQTGGVLDVRRRSTVVVIAAA